jgi:hypothetical protein
MEHFITEGGLGEKCFDGSGEWRPGRNGRVYVAAPDEASRAT